MESETPELMQIRHRKELKDLQGRITNKKKNASKKTRKGVNDECVQMEADLKVKQAGELAALNGTAEAVEEEDQASNGLEKLADSMDENLQQTTEMLRITPPSAPATTNYQTGGGQKRNRQKERLARRAAEQEAATQRAEEEASTMTDRRTQESEYMKQMFKTHELKEKDINPDGHCLFSAIADQLDQNSIPLGELGEMPYRIVRKAAAAYMLENPEDFEPFLEEDLDVYAAKMQETAEWGGHLELMALARRYGVEIRVIQDGRMEKIGEEGGETTRKIMWLAYYRHGYGLGEHYNSLRKAK